MKLLNLKKYQLKYISLLNLYLAQSIPMSFFSTVMPVIMRENGFSLTSIGMLQLIKLPWLLKFVWAPLVDKNSHNLSDYKKWIISSEIFYALTIFLVAFLDFHTDFKLIVILLLIAFTASATQDIATDAFAYLILKKKERSLGSGIQTAGNFLGAVIGTGVLLIIYYYWGWKYLLLSLGTFVLLALIPLLLYPTKNKINFERKQKTGYRDFMLFFKRTGIIYRIIFLISFYWGIIGILSMLKPWMVDLGYSIKEIGIYSGIYGPLFGFIMALLTGKIIGKLGLYKSLFLILFMVLFTDIYFISIHTLAQTRFFLQIGILLIWGVYSMMTVFIYTFIMEYIRKSNAGTDFTLQIVLTHIGSLIIAVFSGKIAHHLGFRNLFLLESFVALFSLIILPYLYKKTQKYEL